MNFVILIAWFFVVVVVSREMTITIEQHGPFETWLECRQQQDAVWARPMHVLPRHFECFEEDHA